MGRLQARRVLIADADPAVREQLFSALLAADVYSDCVSNVPDAIQKMRGEPYGVIVVDIALPGGDAEQVIGAIAGRASVDRPVVLVVAANPALARSLDVEVVQIVLRKPLSLRQTVDVIRSCVESRGTAVQADESDGDTTHTVS